VLWKLRAIVYGGIAVVAALLLIGLGGEDEPKFLEGRTAEDRPFTVELEDGRPKHVGTWIESTCEDGTAGAVRWWSFDGKTTRFGFEDGVLRIREQRRREYDDGWVGERVNTLDARIDDGRMAGTMRYAETVRRGTDSYDCESDEVSFSAGQR
jgi:hypothetical protein